MDRWRALVNVVMNFRVVCISWVINVINNNDDARWKPEITGTVFCIWPDDGSMSRNMSPNF